MSEQDKEQKTEEPTEKRRQKAREQGQLARSADLGFGVMLLCTGVFVAACGDRVQHGFMRLLHVAGGMIRQGVPGDEQTFAASVGHQALIVLLPFFAALVPLAALTAILQIGLHYTPQRLRARPEKLAPNFALNRFVNFRSLVETGTSLLKLVCLVTAYALAVWSELPELMATDSRAALATHGVSIMVRLLLYLGSTLLCIGVIDLALRKWNLKRELRMTKDEVKQEAKDAMGDPEVKARIKGRQRQIAMQRMMDEVPTASVVVTNPTHYAVALRYAAEMAAPKVVAKGRDFVALRIRELAKAAGVPIVPNPPLARALHDSVRPGDEIPPTLYQAVAEVLAAVMKTRRPAGRSA